MIYKIIDGKKVLIADVGKINPISLDDYISNQNIRPGYYFIKEYIWEYDGENWIPPQAGFGVFSGAPDYTSELELITQSDYNSNPLEFKLTKPGWYRISTLKNTDALYYNIILSVKLKDNSLREIANYYHEKYNTTTNPIYFVIPPIYFNGNEILYIHTVQHNPTINSSVFNNSIKKIERYTNYKG
jgi:hypothetical protein